MEYNRKTQPIRIEFDLYNIDGPLTDVVDNIKNLFHHCNRFDEFYGSNSNLSFRCETPTLIEAKTLIKKVIKAAGVSEYEIMVTETHRTLITPSTTTARSG